MSSTTISLIVLASVFGGALVGIFLHAVLPQHHLSNETKDIVKLGMGLVGTMAALVLGLLVASAKGSYDAQSAELTQMSANIDLLDRALALYGPETKEMRDLLRGVVARILDQMWSKDGTGASPVAPTAAGGEILYEKIQGLSPKNDTQRSLQGQALSIAVDIGKTRWLMYAQQRPRFPCRCWSCWFSGSPSFSSVSVSSPLSTRPWSPAYSSPRCRFPVQFS